MFVQGMVLRSSGSQVKRRGRLGLDVASAVSCARRVEGAAAAAPPSAGSAAGVWAPCNTTHIDCLCLLTCIGAAIDSAISKSSRGSSRAARPRAPGAAAGAGERIVF